MHYYSHHIGDFQRDTASLSDADTLAYLRLIWMYYDTEQPLINDPKKLAFRIGSNSDAVQMLLEAFFTLENDVWVQKRCDAEIATYHAKSERAKTANAIRWKSKKDVKSDADQIATNNQEPRTNIKKAPKVATPEGVPDSLWEDFLAIRKAKKLPMTETAMEGLKREAASASKSLSEVLKICCERGWGGFNAKWLERDLPTGGSKQLTMQEEMAMRARAKK
jgi:uncharacterized protein YdaU (DUF1376 family)